MALSFEDWQARNSAPRGLQEQAGAPATQGEQAPAIPDASPGNGGFGWQSWQKGAPQWLTGGNTESTKNGWDTEFMRTYQERYWGTAEKPVTDQQRHDYWDEANKPTGIVLADQGVHKFGDVYKDGVRQGNIRTSYDQQTGDLLLGRLTLSAQELADAKGPEALHRAIETKAADNARQIEAGRTRKVYEGKVEAQKEEWDSTSEIGTVAAGAAGGAALGAMFGPVGAVVGAGVGGAAAWWNRDQFEDIAARAKVQQDMAGHNTSSFDGLTAGVSGWGRYAMQSLNPLTNAINAAYDEWGADAGVIYVDGAYISAAKDSKTGDREVHTAWEGNGGWKTAQMVAGFADGLLTFGSGLGSTAYMAAMAPTAFGKAGLLAYGPGTFDEVTGTFDRPDNAQQWAAGIVDVGIDVVQMGLGRAMGQGASSKLGTFAKPLAQRLGAAEGKDALSLTRNWVRPGDGRAYLLDDAGNAVKSRWTTAMLAPSEFVGAANTRVEALRMVAKDGGAVTADTLYQAARRLETSSTFRAALVNAIGEGSEEAIQTFTEAASHGWNASWSEIVAAYAQGAAMGAGMTVGSRVGRQHKSGFDTQGFIRANNYRAMSAQDPLTPEQWSGMSKTKRRKELTSGEMRDKVLQAGAEKSARDFVTSTVQNVAFIDSVVDATNKMAVKEGDKLNAMTERAYTISGINSAHIPQHAVMGSARTVLEMLDTYKRKGLENLANAADPIDATSGAAQLVALDQVMARLRPLFEMALNPQVPRMNRVLAIRELNTTLQAAYSGYDAADPDGEMSSTARAFTLDMSRDPNDSAGSFLPMMPFISQDNTLLDQNGALQVGFSMLQAMSADFDGDRITNRVRFNPRADEFLSLRTGMQFLGNKDGTSTVTIMEPYFETEEMRLISLAFSDANSANYSNADWFITQTVMSLRELYADVPAFFPLFDQFRANIIKGDVHARMTLLNELTSEKYAAMWMQLGTITRTVTIDGEPTTVHAGTNHLLEISGVILRGIQAWQGTSAGRGTSFIDNRHIESRRKHSDKYPSRGLTQGPTLGATMLAWLVGDNQFRKFQKLHHTDYRAATTDAGLSEWIPQDMLVEFYTLLSGKQTVSSLQLIRSKDEITRTAMEMVERLRVAYSSEGYAPTILQILRMAVPNASREGEFFGGATTVAQLVLRDVATSYEKRDAAKGVLEADPTLAARYRLYKSADGATAMAELLEPYTMYELLGLQAGADFGLNRTFGEFREEYVESSANSRQRTKARLTSAVGGVYVHKLAYGAHDEAVDERDLRENNINDYAILVDALLESGNGTISFDRNAAGGSSVAKARASLTGSRAVQSNFAHDDFIAAMVDAQEALNDLDALLRKRPGGRELVRGKNGYTVAQLAHILEDNYEISAGLAELLPAEIRRLVLTPRADGGLDVSHWFIEMLTLPPEQAAMSLLKNTVLMKLNAGLINPPKDGHAASSDDLLVDLILRMQQADDVSSIMQFEQLLNSATNVHTFMWQVNSQFIGDEAPITAWARDASSRAIVARDGNWSSVDPTKTQRDAMTNLRTKAQRWREAITETSKFSKMDEELIVALVDADSKPAGSTNEQGHLDQLDVALRNAHTRQQILGPRGFLQAIYGNAVGMYGGASDKGSSPTVHAYNGENDVRSDTPAWGTGYEQLIGQITGYSAAEVASNPQVLAQLSEMTLLNDQGEVIAWKQLTRTEFLRLWNTGDQATIALLKAIVFPTAFEMDNRGHLQQRMILQDSLTALLNKSFSEDVMNGQGFHDKVMFATLVEAQARTKTDPGNPDIRSNEAVQRIVSDLTTQRLLNRRSRGQSIDVQGTASQALTDVVDAIRAMLEGDPTELESLYKKSVESRKLRQITGIVNEQQLSVLKSVLLVVADESFRNLGSAEESADALDRFTAFLEGQDFQSARKMFEIDWNGTNVAASQLFIYQYIVAHPDLLTRMSAAEREFLLIRNIGLDSQGNPNKVAVDDKQSQELWDAAANGCLSAVIAELTSITGPGRSTGLLPTGKKAFLSRYYDTSFEFLWAEILNPKSAVMQGAREVREMYGRSSSASSDSKDMDRALNRLRDPELLGEWTETSAAMMIFNQGQIDASGNGAGVARTGSSPEKQNAMSAFTTRTWAMPDAAAHHTTMVLDASLFLTKKLNPSQQWNIDPSSSPLSLGFLEGRFAADARIAYVDAMGAPQSIPLWGAGTIAVPSRAGGEQTRTSPYETISLESINRAWRANERTMSALDGATGLHLEIDIVDPRKQPATSQYANNGYFEGVIPLAAADWYKSLNAAGWFMPGGLNQMGQKQALESAKKSLMALFNADKMDQAAIAEAHALGMTDYYGMLDQLTELVLNTSMGGMRLDHVFRNFVFNELKHTHFVRGWITQDDGSKVGYALTSEQVIEMQRDGQPPHVKDVPLEGVEIQVLAAPAFRTLHGEEGRFALRRAQTRAPKVGSEGLDVNTGAFNRDLFMERLPGMLATDENGFVKGDPFTSPLVRRRLMSRLARVAPVYSTPEMEAMRRRETRFVGLAGEIRQSRLKSPYRNDPKLGFEARNTARVLDLYEANSWSNSGISSIFEKLGVKMDVNLDAGSPAAQMMLRSAMNSLNAIDEYTNDGITTGWEWRFDSAGTREAGVIHGPTQIDPASSSNGSKAEWVSPGDLVNLNTTTIPDTVSARERKRLILEAVDALIDRGVTIGLLTSSLVSDDKAIMADQLRSRGYKRVMMSDSVWIPVRAGEIGMTQLDKALLSRKLSTETISSGSMLVALLGMGVHVEENAAVLFDPENTNRETLLVRDLTPLNALRGFGRPMTQEDNTAITELTEYLATPAGFEYLTRLTAVHTKDGKLSETQQAELLASRDRMIEEFKRSKGNFYTTQRTLQPGDFLPLIKSGGNRAPSVVLYRHGFDPIKHDDQLLAMLAAPRIEGLNPPGAPVMSGNVGVYGPDIMASATTHTGTVVSWEPTKRSAMSVVERVPLQQLANKLVFELNGYKVLTVAPDGAFSRPDFDMIDGISVDMLASWIDSMSKENFHGVVNTAQNAIGYLGLDLAAVYKKALNITSDQQLRDILGMIVRTRGVGMEPTSVDQLLQPERSISDNMLLQMDSLAAALTDAKLDHSWLNDLQTSRSDLNVEQKILRGALTYLMMSGAEVEHVLGANGMASEPGVSELVETVVPPEMFTQIFDTDIELREWLVGQMNQKMSSRPHPRGSGSVGYSFDNNFILTMHNSDPSKTLYGYLQFTEAHSTGDNPSASGLAGDRKGNDPLSGQRTKVALQAAGVTLLQDTELPKTQRYIEGAGARDLSNAAELAALLYHSPQATEGRTRRVRFNVATYEEREQLIVNAATMRATRVALSTDKWVEPEKNIPLLMEKRIELVRALGLPDEYGEIVDYWVRQYLGAPKAPKGVDQDGADEPSASLVLDAIDDMMLNVIHNDLPLAGGFIPTIHADDLQLIFSANDNMNPQWRVNYNAGTNYAETWDQWTHVALSQATDSFTEFDSLFMVANDGMMNTYSTKPGLGGLPVSMNVLMNLSLLDPRRENIVVTADRKMAAVLAEPTVLDSTSVTFEELYRGQQRSGRVTPNSAPATSAVMKQREKIARWRRKSGMTAPESYSIKDVFSDGQTFIEKGLPSNAIARTVVQWSAANRLANPMLWASAPVDAIIRGTLLDARRILSGQSASVLGKTLAQGEEATALAERIRTVGASLASSSEWRSAINQDLYWLQRPGSGRIEHFSASMARKAAMAQDVFFLSRNDVVGRRYVEGIVAELSRRPESQANIDHILTKMQRDPMWAQNHLGKDIRAVAENSLANMRGLKASPMSLMVRNIVDPLSNDRRWYVSTPSTLALKLPLLFQNFYFNVLTEMTGLQAVNAIFSIAMQGKNGGKVGGRFRAALDGKVFDNSPEHREKYGTNWIDETMDSLDIADAFISTGISHTAMMAAGMLAGGLGLAGGDDEERRRRKAARADGFAYLYDPRAIENDFRNADAIWFDSIPSWLPGGEMLQQMFQVSGADDPGGEKSMANLHWTIKQFVSPLLGIARFFDSGNPLDIVWGFEDAIGSMPLARVWDWDNAQAMAAELHAAALDAEQLGSPEDLAESYGFWISMVTTLERYMFENSFINTLYQTKDNYDRNPWALPERETDGSIARDNLNQPMSTKALKDLLDENGEVMSSYMQRDAGDAKLHSLTESRTTLALMFSLFTGLGSSDYLRENMVATTRSIAKPEISMDAAEELILSVWDGKNGAEVLTPDGAEAVFRGLYKGTVSVDDPSLANVFIPFPMRQQIHDKMLSDLIQEGVDAGLDDTKAKKWANDVFYGNSSMGTTYTSMLDIIWNTPEISYAQSTKYYQLNTTYIMGPDGRAWATGIDRAGLSSFFGMAPLTPYGTGDQTMGVDGVLNSVDEIRGINTGGRMLQKIDDTWANPTAEDILDAIEKAGESANGKGFTPSAWKDFGGGRGGGYRRGGGGGYSSTPNYGGGNQRLNSPRRINPAYAQDMRDTFPSTPFVRRATIRRERFSSERGRLNPWQ